MDKFSVHLNADDNLDPATQEALGEMVKAAYKAIMNGWIPKKARRRMETTDQKLAMIKHTAESVLTFLGQPDADVYVSPLKVVVELSNGEKTFWLISLRRIESRDVIGMITAWMMSMANDDEESEDEGG